MALFNMTHELVMLIDRTVSPVNAGLGTCRPGVFLPPAEHTQCAVLCISLLWSPSPVPLLFLISICLILAYLTHTCTRTPSRGMHFPPITAIWTQSACLWGGRTWFCVLQTVFSLPGAKVQLWAQMWLFVLLFPSMPSALCEHLFLCVWCILGAFLDSVQSQHHCADVMGSGVSFWGINLDHRRTCTLLIWSQSGFSLLCLFCFLSFFFSASHGVHTTPISQSESCCVCGCQSVCASSSANHSVSK